MNHFLVWMTHFFHTLNAKDPTDANVRHIFDRHQRTMKTWSKTLWHSLTACRRHCYFFPTFGSSLRWFASSRSSSKDLAYLTRSSGTTPKLQCRLSTYSTWRLQPLNNLNILSGSPRGHARGQEGGGWVRRPRSHKGVVGGREGSVMRSSEVWRSLSLELFCSLLRSLRCLRLDWVDSLACWPGKQGEQIVTI